MDEGSGVPSCLLFDDDARSALTTGIAPQPATGWRAGRLLDWMNHLGTGERGQGVSRTLSQRLGCHEGERAYYVAAAWPAAGRWVLVFHQDRQQLKPPVISLPSQGTIGS